MAEVQLTINGKLYPYPFKDKETRKKYLILMNMFRDGKLNAPGLSKDELTFIGWLSLTFPKTDSSFEDIFSSLLNPKKK